VAFYKRWGFRVLSIALILIAFFIFKKIFSAVDVKTTVVNRQELAITVTATSTGTIKSETEVKITAQRIGKITRLYVEEGSIVKPGSMIAELDPDEAYLNLNIAQASVEKAKSIMKEADARLKRFTDLKEKGYVSHIDFDSIQKEYNVAYASLKEAESSLSLAKLNYNYSFIRSPIAGVVTSMPVKVGETTLTGALAGALVAHVVSMEDLYIEAFIDEADVAKVKLGQQVNITMDAYLGKVFKGEVYLISPVVLGGKQETRTFEVRTRIKEKEIIVKPGMSADVEIVVDNIKSALVIPSSAVMEKNGKKFVFIKRDSTARIIPVDIGQFNWNFTEIKSGVKEGDVVIANPDTSGLADGKRVREIR